jgi:hypothetical protein
VPQHYALFPHLTVGENILFALPKQAHWPGSRKINSSQKARVDELLVTLELEGLERRYPATLSGGQQQRVALARALMAEPCLLLLDEPFNALDVAVRERLRDTLKQFQRHFAIPIVLVTHDHTEVQVHRWSGSGTPSTWTARGAAQWLAELVEAQIQGPSMRLLVRPQWADRSASDDTAEGCILKIYLSKSRWREVEVTPGQLLLLEIGPEAIHFFADNAP